MIRLRRIVEKNGWCLNRCGHESNGGNPMVGSLYCKGNCNHNKGVIKILWLKFVKCNYWG